MGPRAAVGSRRQSPAWHLTRRFRGGGPRVLMAVFVGDVGSPGKVGSRGRPGWTRSPGKGGDRSCPQTGLCQPEQPQRREHLVLLWGLRLGRVGEEEGWSYARG